MHRCSPIKNYFKTVRILGHGINCISGAQQPIKECVNATSLSLCLHYELVFHHKWADAQFFMADVQFFGADAQFFAVGLL